MIHCKRQPLRIETHENDKTLVIDSWKSTNFKQESPKSETWSVLSRQKPKKKRPPNMEAAETPMPEIGRDMAVAVVWEEESN